ncbi:MAG: endonuclease/exonuclease/phosphatase family protein [Pirellulales bacterium]
MPYRMLKPFAALLGLLAVVTTAPLEMPQTLAEEADALRVMTYNLRYASDTPPNSWAVRLPVAISMLGNTDPDVIGIQEGLYRQVKDLDRMLVGYDWIGTGRNGGSHSEFNPIFFQRERLEPLEFEHFWLSDTPDVVGSTSWGNTNIRIVTWVRFRDRQSGREFYAINTHLDHQIPDAREKSAQLILKRIAKLDQSLPMILLGDFNALADSSNVYEILVADNRFSDTWHTEDRRGDTFATFHGYQPVKNGRRIDWILTRGPMRTLSNEVVTFSQKGQYPSDHFPVMADVLLTDPLHE